MAPATSCPTRPGPAVGARARRVVRARATALALVAACAGCAGLDTGRPADLVPLPPPLPALRADLDLVTERYEAPLLDAMRDVLVGHADGLLWTSVADPAAPRAEWSLVRLERRDSYAWLALTVLTAGVANLLGAPAASHDASFRLELVLRDASEVELGRWRVLGRATGWWAAWWGRTDDDAERQALFDALHAALEDARERLADPEQGLAAALARPAATLAP